MKEIKLTLIYTLERVFSLIFFVFLSIACWKFMLSAESSILFIGSIFYLVIFIILIIINLNLLLNKFPKILIDNQYFIYMNIFECKYISLNELEYTKIKKFWIINYFLIRDTKNKLTIQLFGYSSSYVNLIESELKKIVQKNKII